MTDETQTPTQAYEAPIEQLYWSAQTGGFYSSAIHVQLPDEAVEVTAEERAALLEAESTGKVIRAGQDGKPVAADRVFTSEEQKAMHNAPLLLQLAEIDARKVRAMTDAILSKNTARLAALESEAAALRVQLIG